MDREETVQVFGRDGTLATFITNLSQNIINPGTPGTDKASSVKVCTLLSTADCSCTQGYMRNKRTFHYNLSTFTKQEQKCTDSILVSRRSLVIRTQLSMLLIDVTLKL